ncbi:hypothetical protein YYG_01597 [Plasmodium vinckei petteri]|uniref:Uncharacterized protein n=1 Tax=Plasmodium vinckei petteri TaxID=138298 RepID=W7B6I0_PLAVN|nr:hypothetical protein YYG_01597 [Plasmodium vinckei petteri]CAD2109081.1 conserved Plasmodium protein, unknown function [Plasmodium vinckei petteri]
MHKVVLKSFKKWHLYKDGHSFILHGKKGVVTSGNLLLNKEDTKKIELSEDNQNSKSSKNEISSKNIENRIILHKSNYILNGCKINELVSILNLYIKLKSDNVELLKNISINLLMNKEKLRYHDIIIFIKKFSIIKCKNYFLFCYFKDVLMENIHLINYDDLIDIYFSYTNLNYFHYNFFLLLEKKIFHNFHLLDIKKLVCLIQCFKKKRIISKSYLTILLYGISKNINNFNTFQLSVVFGFFRNFNLNNNVLLNSLIHHFNQHINLNDDPKTVALFYNFLSYVHTKCKTNCQHFENEKSLVNFIKTFKLCYEENDLNYEHVCNTKELECIGLNNNENKNEIAQISNDNIVSEAKGIQTTDQIIRSKILELENKYLSKNDELENLKEQTNSLKMNSYNVSLLYSTKNALKNIEIISKKKIKNMSVDSLCLVSLSLSKISTTSKVFLEKIAEEVGKQSNKLTPLLVSSLLLSFSKANHRHGSLIYYSLKFFYKYYNFFNINQVGFLCKGLYNFSIKENEFIDVLNGFVLNNLQNCNNLCTDKEFHDENTLSGIHKEYLNYNDNALSTFRNKELNKLFHIVETNIDKNIEWRNYEDQFLNLKRVYNENDKKDDKKNADKYKNEVDSNFLKFSYIDYENIKNKKYCTNSLYNIKMSNTVYINNIIYILEYYAFNLVSISNILESFCDIFLKSNLNYILYTRIFHSFYLLKYKGEKVYELIEKFNEYQPLQQNMYKEKHTQQLLQSLLYYYENNDNNDEKANKIGDIYFYILSKKYFSFIFNFSKYILTFLFIKNNNYVLHKFLINIKDIPLNRENYIFLHRPINLY